MPYVHDGNQRPPTLQLQCRHCGHTFSDDLLSLELSPFNRACSHCGCELPIEVLVPLVTSMRNCLKNWHIRIDTRSKVTEEVAA